MGPSTGPEIGASPSYEPIAPYIIAGSSVKKLREPRANIFDFAYVHGEICLNVAMSWGK